MKTYDKNENLTLKNENKNNDFTNLLYSALVDKQASRKEEVSKCNLLNKFKKKSQLTQLEGKLRHQPMRNENLIEFWIISEGNSFTAKISLKANTNIKLKNVVCTV